LISVSVDLATHGEAVDLMRALDGFHPWTVQLGPEQWVVVARAERRERVDTVTALVSHWAAEHHLGPLPCRAGEDDVPAPAGTP
jgi:hypothetical protein